MFSKFLDYFIGGTNHYPFINQWHDITNFIRQYVSEDRDIVYLLQIGIASLLIFSFLFVVMIIFNFVLDTMFRVLSKLW